MYMIIFADSAIPLAAVSELNASLDLIGQTNTAVTAALSRESIIAVNLINYYCIIMSPTF
jgi:hypothetical protein